MKDLLNNWVTLKVFLLEHSKHLFILSRAVALSPSPSELSNVILSPLLRRLVSAKIRWGLKIPAAEERTECTSLWGKINFELPATLAGLFWQNLSPSSSQSSRSLRWSPDSSMRGKILPPSYPPPSMSQAHSHSALTFYLRFFFPKSSH